MTSSFALTSILAAAVVAAPLARVAPAQVAAQLTCVGDCDDDDRVAVDEVILLVRVALGDVPVDQCPRLDGPPSIEDLVGSVSNAISGCVRRPLLVLSAFPAELSAVLEYATVDDVMLVNGKMFRLGSIGEEPVIMGMTGIGLVNATTTTRAALEQFDVRGVIVSGVAGSTFRIGDVTVPESWTLNGATAYAAHAPWVELAREVAAADSVVLEKCTFKPAEPTEEVCLLHDPAVVVGGTGNSSDPFNNMAAPCQPTGGDVFACDVPLPEASGSGQQLGIEGTTAAAIAQDMETAAIGSEAVAHGIPFIAFRAVSDGEGDPLMLTVPFAQFFVYYRLAANNAAAATVAFLERMAAPAAPSRPPS